MFEGGVSDIINCMYLKFQMVFFLSGFQPSLVLINSIVKCWLYKQCVLLSQVGRKQLVVWTHGQYYIHECCNYTVDSFIINCYITEKTMLILETFQMYGISNTNFLFKIKRMNTKEGHQITLFQRVWRSSLIFWGRGGKGIDTLVSA